MNLKLFQNVVLVEIFVTLHGRNTSNEVLMDVRLVNGSSPYEGRVEVKVNGHWGTVCDNNWSRLAGAVVCKRLGFDGVDEVFSGAKFGAGSGPIYHDKLQCTGKEHTLNECPGIHDPSKVNCAHLEDASVRCQRIQVHQANAHLTCHEQQYMCLSRRMCIPARWVCDDHVDCDDVSDEFPQLCKLSLNCGIQQISPITTRIVGGNSARERSWPWMVSLKVKIQGIMSDSILCGGTLIDPNWILTAAHCFNHYNPSTATFHAVLGEYNTQLQDKMEQDIPVKSVKIHEQYRIGIHDYDIALVQLKHPATMHYPYVNKVCLPKYGDTPFSQTDHCFVTGWGDTKGTAPPHILQEAMVPIINKTLCSTWYGQTIKDGMFCAGYQFGGIDACKGDSGGPLSCKRNGRWFVAGIVSWGDGCARDHHPGIYTDVSHFISWLAKAIDTQSARPSSIIIG